MTQEARASNINNGDSGDGLKIIIFILFSFSNLMFVCFIFRE